MLETYGLTLELRRGKGVIERRNDIEDEIHPHYQWNNQHAKAMSYQSKSSEENDISEIIDMHRQAK